MWIDQKKAVPVEHQDLVQELQVCLNRVFSFYIQVSWIWSIIFEGFETVDILRNYQLSQFYRYISNIAGF